MLARRLPRSAVPSVMMRTAVAAMAVGAGVTAGPAADSALAAGDMIDGCSWTVSCNGHHVEYGPRRMVWQASLSPNVNCYLDPSHCGDLDCMWAQDSPYPTTGVPDPNTFRWEEDYYRQYAAHPYPYEGNLIGDEICSTGQMQVRTYPANRNLRGTAYKSGLDNDAGGHRYSGTQLY